MPTYLGKKKFFDWTWRVFTYNIFIQIHTISEKILQTYYSSEFIHKNITSYLKTREQVMEINSFNISEQVNIFRKYQNY